MENHFEFAKGQINSIAKQLVSAMEALHKCSIIHRDIKPDNIIMNSEGHIWLIDYDIARIVNNEEKIQPFWERSDMRLLSNSV